MSYTEFSLNEYEVIKFKKRKYVRLLTNAAIKRGDLVRSPTCEICSFKGSTCAHHVDYGQPFKILWLCSKCHGKVHAKNHALNPENNLQSSLPSCLDSKDCVDIAFSLPSKNFLALRSAAIDKGISLSKLIRDELMHKFPVKQNQLEFKFEDRINDMPPNESISGVQNMGQNKIEMLQQKRSALSKIRSDGNSYVRRMEEQLCKIS